MIEEGDCVMDRAHDAMSEGGTGVLHGTGQEVGARRSHGAGRCAAVRSRAANGEALGLADGWIAALGFTLQIYFDFSGYTDMALGLARFFGIKLPVNFNSPLKAASIIEFWQRWHISLTRFLTEYNYNPLSLPLARKRMATGKPGFGGRDTTVASFSILLLLPTMLTMFISGLWHGAGYTYIVWGLMHGAMISINHGG
jgi:alginate O-acetyltransferase complex protein AlgI